MLHTSAGRGLLRFIVVLIEDGSYLPAGSEYATSKAELAITKVYRPTIQHWYLLK